MTTTDPSPPAPPPEDEPVRRIQRSRKNRWLLGVSGGLAEYFGLHPAIYRVLFVALAFAGGTGIFLYLALALVMPDENAEDSVLADMLRRHRNRPWLVIGLALLALLVLSTLGDGPGDQVGALLLVLVVGGVIFLWVRASRRDARRREATGRRSIRWRVAAVTALLGVVVAAAAAGGAALAHGKGGVGDRVERPRDVDDLDDEYELGFGHLQLDLRELRLPLGETRVHARVGVGELDVVVPDGVALSVSGDVRWGEADILGERDEGDDVRESVVDFGFDEAERRLVVDAEVGAGELTVSR